MQHQALLERSLLVVAFAAAASACSSRKEPAAPAQAVIAVYAITVQRPALHLAGQLTHRVAPLWRAGVYAAVPLIVLSRSFTEGMPPMAWNVDDAAMGRRGALAPVAATLKWRAFVRDPAMDKLIDQAQANNRSLRQTLLYVGAVRAQFRVEHASRRPSVAPLLAGSAHQSSPETPANVPILVHEMRKDFAIAALATLFTALGGGWSAGGPSVAFAKVAFQ